MQVAGFKLEPLKKILILTTKFFKHPQATFSTYSNPSPLHLIGHFLPNWYQFLLLKTLWAAVHSLKLLFSQCVFPAISGTFPWCIRGKNYSLIYRGILSSILGYTFYLHWYRRESSLTFITVKRGKKIKNKCRRNKEERKNTS